MLFAFCWQDKHLNPLDLPVTVSSTAGVEGLALLVGGQSWAGSIWAGLAAQGTGPGKIADVCHWNARKPLREPGKDCGRLIWDSGQAFPPHASEGGQSGGASWLPVLV